jgi:hypothetical protein
MKKYDLHIHTAYSSCSLNSPTTILKLAKKNKLDGIAITDHNIIKGALKTKKLNKNKDLDIIIGEEISTNCGDLIALYVQEEIKKKNLFEVIDIAKQQDAILIIPHPFRAVPKMKFKYPLEKLQGKVDAIETFNSRNFFFSNNKAKKAVENLKFAKVGSSDAHIPFDIGKAYTTFQGDLRKAIKSMKTKPIGTTINMPLSAITSSFSRRVLTPLGIKKWIFGY